MKKTILSGLAMLFLMFGATGITSATSLLSFSDTYDFHTENEDYIEIVAKHADAYYSYEHEISLTDFVITSYSIHYTKLYEPGPVPPGR